MSVPKRPSFLDREHQLIYGAVLDVREKMLDLKAHVNDELEAQRKVLELKADRNEINLILLWKQSPLWMKVISLAVAVSTAAIAALLPNLPSNLPF